MKKLLHILLPIITVAAILPISVMPVSASIIEGTSDNGILVTEWTHQLYPNNGPGDWQDWGYFGSSPGIADFGSDVGDGDANLEIVTGSEALGHYEPDLGAHVLGAWHMFSHDGTTLWAKDTLSDQARGDVGIADLDGDGYLEIAAGTTSGRTVEVMDRHGNWVWTFPHPPEQGDFNWPGGTTIADVNPTNGLEVIIGNRLLGRVFAFDGDNSDLVNDGHTANPAYWPGTEGVDWDVLWVYNLGGEIYSTGAMGDIDDDGSKEIVIGSTNGDLVSLDASTGALEWSFNIGAAICGSAALADFDGDGDLEVVIGATDSNVYFIEGDSDSSGTIDADEYTSYATSGPVYSSASIGDVDNDGDLETLIGSNDGYLRSFDYDPITGVTLNWSSNLGGELYSSPSLANRNDIQNYTREWPMFRHDLQRTGFYGATTDTLDVYIGSTNGSLYLVDGPTGAIIDSFFVGYRGDDDPNQIRTSPSIADVDGDGKLEIFLYEWGSEDTFWAIEDTMNYRPIADPNGPYLVEVTSPDILLDGTGSYDPDDDPLTYTWTDRDGKIIGSGATPPSPYTEVGVYRVWLTVDDVVHSDTKSTLVVIYDPGAGFVTGGGWIDSPPGAYTDDPLLTGKANFGFVAKYKKGAEVPDGQTEFQFHMADLNFHSSSYDWLVVTGHERAQFRGSGTINGMGDYKFMLVALDDPDCFRIIIWGGNGIVYDNGAPPQEIAGGSIVIHTK
ncbi:FG-GAP-like repeat-containing protein [Chloroflexota bacterium]